MRRRALVIASLAAGLAGSAVARPVAAEPDPAAIGRGQAVLRASGGCSCHTDFEGGGPALAGGRPLRTPFGIYYSTNITPDPDTGIGHMSDADFLRAMREGVAPDGSQLFPVFPYTSFTGMSDADLLDLKAYLFSLEPVARENRSPEAWLPFRWRAGIRLWKWLNFEPGRFAPDPDRSEAWNRGAYLVTAVAHCGECHTPRTTSGGLDTSRALAGSEQGPEGELAPNLTPHATGLSEWSSEDVAWYLESGLEPDGDDAGGLMAEVIEHGYQHLPAADLAAIALYLRELPPIENDLGEGHDHDKDHGQADHDKDPGHDDHDRGHPH